MKNKKVRHYLPYCNQEILGGICLILPVHIASEANCTQHWSEKHKRHENQKDLVRASLINQKIPLPCHVKMHRFGPRLLDEEDNLRTAFKYLKDYIAAEITGDYHPGRADSNPKITWSYSQEKSSLYGAKVLILFGRSDCPAEHQFDLES